MKCHLLSLAALALAPFAATTAAQAQTEPMSAPAPMMEEEPWSTRYAPFNNMFEVGLFGGVMFPAEQHELYELDESADAVDRGWKPLDDILPDFGFRLGYFPSKFIGVEAELAVIPAGVQDTTDSALLFAYRGHLVAQLGLWSVVPFITVGGGGLTITGDALGDDTDYSFNFGGGIKAYISDDWMIRADVRDNVTNRFNDVYLSNEDNDDIAHHLEALIGVSYVVGRPSAPPPPPPPVDSDGDGFTDDLDACPGEAGVAPDGCPEADTDGDSFVDSQDKCPQEPGIAPDGCPEPDTDADGFKDSQDQCPQEAGVAPDGCPIRDTDGDGIMDPNDKCVDQAENVNGFQDDDGCPDEIPEAVKNFTGVIQGIYFDTGKSTVKPNSETVLDGAVKVMLEYPGVRVVITGHTDSRGSEEKNLLLSRERAESVKGYLVSKGIPSSRIETVGAGPAEPIATNNTRAGRAKNRRIEFKLLSR